jgi:glycosyltransferase involved in cell wall biosynthesis
LLSDARTEFTIVIVDNGSNEQTQEVIRKYEKDVDLIIRHDWNIGYCFGVNSWLVLREEEQTCVQVDQDMVMCSRDWWSMVKPILQDPDIGVLAARRPTSWIDRQEKWDFYTGAGHMRFEKRHDHWLEMPHNNLLNAPLLIYKGLVLDQIGFENEATGWGDMESYYRVMALGMKTAYIPDIFLYQPDNSFEECDHPQRNAHRVLLGMRRDLNQQFIERYVQGRDIYCGTRFLPLTILDPEYKRYSDENFEFHRTWRE